MPVDTGGSSLDIVWILEDHQSLSGDALGEMLWLFTCKVLFEHVDLIVLLDSLGDDLNHFFCGL